jgi:hypothetical protein
MTQKLSIESVESFLDSVGLKIFGDYTYNDCFSKMSLIDIEGYKYSLSLDSIKTNVRSGNKSFQKVSKNNIFSNENIQMWIFKNDKKYCIIDGIFESARTRNLKMRCEVCGQEWTTNWNSLESGRGCEPCSRKSAGNKRRISINDVIDEFLKNDIILLDESSYTKTEEKVLVECLLCGHRWETDYHHVRKGRSCPLCKSSRGERRVKNFLKSKNINFIHQKRFEECRSIKPLPFDFYLPELNVCIEYNGEQHYGPYPRFGGELSFQGTRKRDVIKSNFCLNNNITLIVIKYTDFDNIETLLGDVLSQ